MAQQKAMPRKVWGVVKHKHIFPIRARFCYTPTPIITLHKVRFEKLCNYRCGGIIYYYGSTIITNDLNNLSNILASGAGEADVKIDDKDIETVTLVEIDGVHTLVIAGVE